MSTTRHVSARVTAQLLDQLQASGFDLPDWHALGMDEAKLLDASAWLTWNEYIGFLQGLAGPGASPERHEAVGERVMVTAKHTPFRHMGTLFGGARALFDLTYGWVLPTQMPVLQSEIRTQERHRILIDIRLRADLDGTVFFHSLTGTMRKLPSLLSQPDAEIELTQSGPSHATFTVSFGPSTSLRGRLSRAWSALTDVQDLDIAMEGLHHSVTTTMGRLHDANRELAASESRWRTLAEHLPGVVLVLDEDGIVESLHGGIPVDPAVVGHPLLSVYGGVPEERANDVEALLHEALVEGEPSALEFPVRDHSEPERWWSCRAAPLPSDKPRAILLALDVTAEHQIQEQLRLSEQRLLQAQKLEAIGRMAAGIAHDFNNVLAAVHGHADLLSLHHPEDAAVRQSVEGITGAVDRAKSLTQRLLAFGRPQPQPAGSPPTIDLSNVLREAEDLLRGLIGADIDLQVETDARPLWIEADSTQVQQILLNLTVNARDAMPGGGHLTLRTGRQHEMAVLEVIDDGQGMTRDVREKVFEPFFTTKPPGAGTGLGMATVWAIVDRHGGALEVTSSPGEGSHIRIVLPLTHAPDPVSAPAPAAPQRPTFAPGNAKSVWVVEDQPDVRVLVQTMLTRSGYVVRPFADAREALAAQGIPDLVVTDIVMPGPSGIELAHTLVARWPTLPVLLMSGHTEDNPGALAAHTTRHAFLRKPFAMEELLGTVTTLLEPMEAD